MIAGVVNSSLQAIVPLTVRGPSGQAVQINTVVDSGYNGFLGLTSAVIAMLGLPWLQSVQATLADGSSTMIDIHGGTVDWDGTQRHVEVDAIDGEILLGTLMLHRHILRIDFIAGGTVEITARPCATRLRTTRSSAPPQTPRPGPTCFGNRRLVVCGCSPPRSTSVECCSMIPITPQ